MGKRFIHIFEEAGLGIAPFSVHLVVQSGWSSCQYCGTGIKEHCYIKDVNGKIFLVGNECVYKTGDVGIVDPVRRETNRLRTEARHKKQDEKIAKAQAILEGSPEVKEILQATPHPHRYRAEIGQTMMDWVESMFKFAGRKGKCEAAKVIEEAASKKLSKEDLQELINKKEKLVADYRERKRKEEEEIKLEVARQEAERIKNLKKTIEDNKFIIEVLEKINQTPFVNSMLNLLYNQPLRDFTTRQLEAMSDIYAKFDGDKRGSEEYKERLKEFYEKVQVDYNERRSIKTN